MVVIMNGVSQITVTEDVSLITFHSVPYDFKLIAGIFTAFAKQDIDIDMISQTAPQGDQVSISFTVNGGDTVKVLEVAKGFRDRPNSIKPMVITGNVKLSLYGGEMRGMPGVAAAAMTAIAETNAQISLITTSESDISFLMTQTHLDEAIAALESKFGVKAQS